LNWRRDQIDEGDRDVLLKQGGTLGHERSPVFGPVLVRRTDDLDRGYQPPVPLGVIDPQASSARCRTKKTPKKATAIVFLGR
jgi:hypothetical protein